MLPLTLKWVMSDGMIPLTCLIIRKFITFKSVKVLQSKRIIEVILNNNKFQEQQLKSSRFKNDNKNR